MTPSGPLGPEAWTYALLAGALAFAVSLIGGRPSIALLRRAGVGKEIRAEGPSSHLSKVGTPTMGGVVILVAVFAVTLPLNLVGRLSILLPLGTIVACGILGGVDDLLSTVGRSGQGLRARFKMVWLLIFAATAAYVLYFVLGLRSAYVPFVGKLDIGLWYLPIATLVIAFMANAVNFTDGLDTLAGGEAALSFAAYGVVAFLQQQAYLVTFCFTVVGAVLGFLWYNAHPAQVFMGDTGSLALGGALGVISVAIKHEIVLAIIGGLFVAELLSVIIQVAYFKRTGKRIFLMAPIHHHFEKLGWPESTVVIRFWIVSLMLAFLGLATLKLR